MENGIRLTICEVIASNKTLDEMVCIFSRVNSTAALSSPLNIVIDFGKIVILAKGSVAESNNPKLNLMKGRLAKRTGWKTLSDLLCPLNHWRRSAADGFGSSETWWPSIGRNNKVRYLLRLIGKVMAYSHSLTMSPFCFLLEHLNHPAAHISVWPCLWYVTHPFLSNNFNYSFWS